MKEIVSRRAFLAYGFIVSGTFLAEACAPKPLKPSNIIASLTPLPSITQEHTKTSEPPLDPYPPIEAKGWAEKHKGTGPDKESIPGTLDPERMYEFVGDWNLINTQGVRLASSKNRAIDLTWKGIGLIFVGDQDISHMSDVDRDAYRSYIADHLNNNQELKRQLNDITDRVSSIGQSTVAMKFVINGPEFSGLTAYSG